MAIALPTPGWMTDAACAVVNADLFFPERGGDSAPEIREAKKVCAGCPVRVECLNYALDNYEGRYGVWGGTTPAERRRLLRLRREGLVA